MIFVKSLAVPLKFKSVVSSFGFPDTAFHLKSVPFAMYEGHPSTWSERRRPPIQKNPAVKPAAKLEAAAAPNEAMAAAVREKYSPCWPPAAPAQEDSAAYAAAKQTSVDDVKEINNNNKLHHLLREILDREKQNEELLKELRDQMGDVFARVNITAMKLDDLDVLVNDMNHQANDMNHQVNKMEKMMVQASAPEVVPLPQWLSAVSDQDSDK